MTRLLKVQASEPGTENLTTILTEEVLEVDRQLLSIAKSSMEISGLFSWLDVIKQKYPITS